MITVRKVTITDLDAITDLFDAYRVFYQQDSDKKSAKAFLKERFEQKQSVIFIAEKAGVAVGFTQLYPIFSSVSMQKTLVLKGFLSHAKNSCLKRFLSYAKTFVLNGLVLKGF